MPFRLISRRHFSHTPVLPREVLLALGLPRTTPSASPLRFVDATVGGGGHASLVAAALSGSAREWSLLGLDVDVEALRAASSSLGAWRERATLLHGSYAHIAGAAAAAAAAGARGWELHGNAPPLLDGVLADLGVSSHQLDAPRRGFSVRLDHDGPLDMRMWCEGGGGGGELTQPGGGARAFAPLSPPGPLPCASGVSAGELVNHLPEAELARLFREYGEEPQAAAVARAVVAARAAAAPAPLCSTAELARLIGGAIRAAEARGRRGRAGGAGSGGGAGGGGAHPATRCFQALRMAVNGELEAVRALLDSAPRLLAPGGRLAVISFHSLEDRLVKRAFAELVRGGEGAQPAAAGGQRAAAGAPLAAAPARRPRWRLVFKRGVTASEEEIAANPRARSATLRAVERLAEPSEGEGAI